MIPNTKDRKLETQGVTASTVFGISVEDTAHIMSILRDTLYTDKVSAVLREYSANAWDSQRESGKGDVPIKVTIPTDMDPTLRIQDFGSGLSHEGVFEVFTKYGASTKRNSDNSVGMLGIGSKSGFAYSDSFTVISCHGGVRRTYVAILDASEKGVINLLDEAECGDETGVTIEIAIRKSDIPEFIVKAKNLYQYFQPRPIINIDLPEETTSQLDMKNGIIDESDSRDHWVAVMGCVPYRINIEQLYENGRRMVGSYIDNIKGVLRFDIGEVQVNASREELKYSDMTKRALVSKFAALMDEYVETTIKNIEAGTFSPWQKRMRAKMMDQLELPLSPALKELCKEYVDLPAHTTFKMYRTVASNDTSRIPLDSEVRLFLRDDETKSIKGYQFEDYDYVIRPVTGQDLTTVKKELEQVLEKAGLTGVSISVLSTLRWSIPHDQQREEQRLKQEEERKARRAEIRKLTKGFKKYFSRVFTLKPDNAFEPPYSQMWDVIKEYEPKAEDVYVFMENFRIGGPKPRYSTDPHRKFLENLKKDIALCKLSGIPFPVVYGYKSTDKLPLEEKDIVGIPYEKWREKFFKQELESPKFQKAFLTLEWVTAIPFQYNYDSVLYDPKSALRTSIKSRDRLIAILGSRHPITKWIAKAVSYIEKWAEMDELQRNGIRELSNRVHPNKRKSEAVKEFEQILKMYPVIGSRRDTLAVLWEDRNNSETPASVWFEYIKDMDRLRKFQNRNRRK